MRRRLEARSMADESSKGKFVWYDLMTPDEKGAEAFYTKVIGWGTQAFGGPTPYKMWTAGGTPIGGVMKNPPGPPPFWIGYVSVPDIEATLKQATSLGGTVHVPATDIPDVGRFAIFADPQNAAIALFSAKGERPATPPGVGQFSWHELAAADYRSAVQFYQSLFGWETLAEHDMGPMGIYLIFGRNGQQLGGMFNKPASMPAPPHWLYYISVDSADRVANLVKENGGQILNGPMDVPGGDRIAQCMDPQGVAFALHSRAQK
jgi:uncharacterized protein